MRELILKVAYFKKTVKRKFEVELEDKIKEIKKDLQSPEKKNKSTFAEFENKTEELKIQIDELKKEISKVEKEKKYEQEKRESNFDWYKSEIQRKDEILQRITMELQGEKDQLLKDNSETHETITNLKNEKKILKK